MFPAKTAQQFKTTKLEKEFWSDSFANYYNKGERYQILFEPLYLWEKEDNGLFVRELGNVAQCTGPKLVKKMA